MLEKIIKDTMQEVGAKFGKSITSSFDEDSILLDLGLDSLCYAVLVVELEEKLGLDPFQLEQEIIYPRTFGEFLSLYKKHLPSEN